MSGLNQKTFLVLKPNTSFEAHQALFLPHEDSVDSNHLLAALAKSIDKHSLSQVLDDEVISLESVANTQGWVVSTRQSGRISTPNVVLCAGAWIQALIDNSKLHQVPAPAVCFGKGVSCLLTDMPRIPHTLRTPNRSFACGIHLVPRADECVYLGATNRFGLSTDAVKGIQPGELHSLFSDAIHQINTSIRTATIKQTFFGLRPISVDGRPLIGQTELPGLLVATGTYRNGVLMAPLIARRLVAELLHAEPSVENVFSPKLRRVRDADHVKRIIAVGIRDLLSFVREPGGFLPYNRSCELEHFVRVLFEMAVLKDSGNSLRQEDLQSLLQDIPLDEVIPHIYYEILKSAKLANTQ